MVVTEILFPKEKVVKTSSLSDEIETIFIFDKLHGITLSRRLGTL